MGLFGSHDTSSTILAQGKYLTLDERKNRLNNIILVGSSGRGNTRSFRQDLRTEQGLSHYTHVRVVIRNVHNAKWHQGLLLSRYDLLR